MTSARTAPINPGDRQAARTRANQIPPRAKRLQCPSRKHRMGRGGGTARPGVHNLILHKGKQLEP